MGILASAGRGPKIPLPDSPATETTTTGSTTSKTVNLPTVAVGDLLILIYVNNGNGSPSSTPPTGWTLLNSGNNHATYYRSCDGSEGSTVTVTVTNGAQNSKPIVIRIPAALRDTAANPESGVSQVSTASPNPPSVTASWGSGPNNLVLAYCAVDAAATTGITGFPAGYTDYYNSSNGIAWLRVAYVNSVVAANDPGAFTLTGGAVQNTAGTILVKGT